ncbi:hypothetical protein NQ117_20275 [Paenibacillus sp. SC116]|uniref:hypothetical protein n=1 Tax=Paenibacillus sp. SC116 TaxID=2968986 RepID=UPI00215A96E2|nr:hypothetical protein [Paenibacillus sp. SC116]MCR8846020.1 hypothetical protein [Paenibacillus sp. SC116]
MLPIQVDENEIKKFCGRPVCVVTKDGRRYVGRLSSCDGGKLILNDNPFHAQSHSNIPILTDTQTKTKSDHTKKKNTNSSPKKKGTKGKTASESDFHPNFDNQAFNPYEGNPYGEPYPNHFPGPAPEGFPPPYPYPSGRGAFGFELAAIAFLFLLLL